MKIYLYFILVLFIAEKSYGAVDQINPQDGHGAYFEEGPSKKLKDQIISGSDRQEDKPITPNLTTLKTFEGYGKHQGALYDEAMELIYNTPPSKIKEKTYKTVADYFIVSAVMGLNNGFLWDPIEYISGFQEELVEDIKNGKYLEVREKLLPLIIKDHKKFYEENDLPI